MKYRLSNAYEWFGEWWVPGKEPRSVVGILKFDSQVGATLRVFDKFPPVDGGDIFEDMSGGLGESRLIHGSSEGVKITLFGCSLKESSSRGFIEDDSLIRVEQVLRSDLLLIGLHVGERNAVWLSEIEAEIVNLTFWSGEARFVESKIMGGVNQQLRSEITTRGPGEVGDEVVEVSDVQYSLKRSVVIEQWKMTGGSARVGSREHATLRLVTKSPVSIEDARMMVHDFSMLLSLALDVQAPVASLRVGAQGDAGLPYGGGAHLLWKPIDIPRLENPCPRWDELFFTTHDISFIEVVPGWCRLLRYHADSLKLLLTLIEYRDEYVQTRALLTAACLEALHKSLLRDEGSRFFEWLGTRQPVDFESRDGNGAHPEKWSFRRRLCSLALYLSDCSGPLVDLYVDSWTKDFTAIRHGIVHNAELRDVPEARAHGATEIGDIIARFAIFAELGVDALFKNGEIDSRRVDIVNGLIRRFYLTTVQGNDH